MEQQQDNQQHGARRPAAGVLQVLGRAGLLAAAGLGLATVLGWLPVAAVGVVAAAGALGAACLLGAEAIRTQAARNREVRERQTRQDAEADSRAVAKGLTVEGQAVAPAGVELRRAAPLKLAGIKQLLPFMQDEGVLSPASVLAVEEHLESLRALGVTLFTGDLAVEIGVVNETTGKPLTREDVQRSLAEQVVRKAEAAAEDIQTIAGHGRQQAPAWLKANWGNNGINPAPQHSTVVDGIAAAANIAQNLVMLANARPELAEAATPGVSAAANLARGMARGDAALMPPAVMQTVKDGLRHVVAKSGGELCDNWGGQRIDLEEFIAERGKEIERGIRLSLANAQYRGQAGAVRPLSL